MRAIECKFVMDFGYDKGRIYVDGDRLSCLPVDLIHKILSFIGIKYAVQTSCLSPRWRFVWTSMPYLNFSSEDFCTLPKFSKFVTHVLTHHNNQIELSSVKLNFRGKASQVFVRKIMNYAFSHNVQEFTVSSWSHNQLPLSFFSSQSLKNLSLILMDSFYGFPVTPPSTWDLPALTTLYISRAKFYDDNTGNGLGLISKCANLNNLTLKQFSTEGLNGLSICHPRLSNLTFEDGYCGGKGISVVAPQLKNLNIIGASEEHLISAPELASLSYDGFQPLQLSTDSFYSLEKVDLRFRSLYNADAGKIDRLLQQLQSAKYLTLNSEILEFLSSSAEVISQQPSPFANLKSVKIYPIHLEHQAHKNATMSIEVKNYLLDNSPSATFTMVSRKEMTDLRDAKRAQHLIRELSALLEERKARRETIKQGKAPMKRHKQEMQVPIDNKALLSSKKRLGGRMEKIKRYWEGLEVEINQGKWKTNDILSRLSHIEGLLVTLPTWHTAEMQAQFSRLCVEADAFMKNVIDRKKFQVNKKQRRLNVYFRKLAAASQPSSQVPSTSGITPMQ